MRKLDKYLLVLNTIKFLKMKQIYYRLYYIFRSRFRKIVGFKYKLLKESSSFNLDLQRSINVIDCYMEGNEFTFLNLSIKFKEIDWNYDKYGKLWTYNLNYFDFLSQDNSHNKIELINSFIDNSSDIDVGLDSFPISLRGINWIKYISYKNINNKKIDDSLYAQYYILIDNLEYHLLGNHLLENGFSMLFGAYYFQDKKLYNKAKEILLEQLNEQILDDGGHFELSPMYHQIMLFRLLDSINLVRNNNYRNQELLSFFINTSKKMLGWLKVISYKNGDIPYLNDATKDIAPTTNQLFDYAKRLNIEILDIKLNESGYRKIVRDKYELIIDIANIKAKYIAGHTHADTFNFELRINNKPFIVDVGISTYEIGERRDYERSTKAHNTVEVNDKNQSEIWGGFRVGNRANVINLKEGLDFIQATHNGYKDILHTRRWSFTNSSLIIEDKLNKDYIGVARLHFHPSISKEYILKHIKIDVDNWKIDDYIFSNGYNQYFKSKVLKISFSYLLSIKIVI